MRIRIENKDHTLNDLMVSNVSVGSKFVTFNWDKERYKEKLELVHLGKPIRFGYVFIKGVAYFGFNVDAHQTASARLREYIRSNHDEYNGMFCIDEVPILTKKVYIILLENEKVVKVCGCASIVNDEVHLHDVPQNKWEPEKQETFCNIMLFNNQQEIITTQKSVRRRPLKHENDQYAGMRFRTPLSDITIRELIDGGIGEKQELIPAIKIA